MMSWGMINCIKENLYLVILGEITVLNNCSLGKNSEMNQRHTVGYIIWQKANREIVLQKL